MPHASRVREVSIKALVSLTNPGCAAKWVADITRPKLLDVRSSLAFLTTEIVSDDSALPFSPD